MEKFISMKAVEKQHKINLVKFRDKIKTMKIIDENFEENRIKHFKFWIEIMVFKGIKNIISIYEGNFRINILLLYLKDNEYILMFYILIKY